MFSCIFYFLFYDPWNKRFHICFKAYMWLFISVKRPFLLGFPFAKLLRNFCGTKRKIFLSKRISFARKNNNCTKKLRKLEFRFMRNFRKKYFSLRFIRKNSAKVRKIAQILRKRFSHYVETLVSLKILHRSLLRFFAHFLIADSI